MPTPYGSVRKELAECLRVAIEQIGYTAMVAEVEETIEFAKNVADIASSIVFRITKATERKPSEIAGAIRSSIRVPSYIESVSADNGFINFHLNRAAFAEMVIGNVLEDGSDAVCSEVGKGRKVVTEYPSANPVHPLHVGQLRNALLGDAVSRLHALCNYVVEREDYIDDLGLQAAEAIWGYMHTDEPEPNKKFDHWLGEIYVNTNKLMEDEKVKSAVDETLRYMEDMETKESRMARALSERCVTAHHETEFNYGIMHDLLIWESDIVREGLLKKVLALLETHGIAKKQIEGKYKDCIIMVGKSSSTEEESEPKVLVRSNGTATYFAKDVAFHMWKFGLIPDPFKYTLFVEHKGKKIYTTAEHGEKMELPKADIVINVIDSRQNLLQALLKTAFELMGEARVAANIKHLSYGVVELESGPLAGRRGTWIGNTADDLLDQAHTKASSMIGTRFKLSEEQKNEVAKSTALAAIKFEFLRVAPEKNIVFSWKRALSFDGDSGPYCQYMCARAIRLIEDSKMSVKEIKAIDSTAVADNHSFELVKQLSKASDIVQKACRELRPNVITDYLIDLATAYSRFYENVPVLKATTVTEKEARLALTIAFKSIMSAMMDSIGVATIERM